MTCHRWIYQLGWYGQAPLACVVRYGLGKLELSGALNAFLKLRFGLLVASYLISVLRDWSAAFSERIRSVRYMSPVKKSCE